MVKVSVFPQVLGASEFVDWWTLHDKLYDTPLSRMKFVSIFQDDCFLYLKNSSAYTTVLTYSQELDFVSVQENFIIRL